VNEVGAVSYQSRIHASDLEENLAIIRNEIISEIDRGLDFADKKIANIYIGMFSFVVNPLARLIFKYFAMREARKRGLERVDLFINCIREACTSRKSVDRIVDENFEEFLNCNEIWIRRNPSHKRIAEFRKSLKEEFRLQMIIFDKVVCARGNSYSELVRNAYPDRRALDELVERQFKMVETQMKLAEEKDLLKIPSAIRTEVTQIMRYVFDYAKNRIREKSDEIYGGWSQPQQTARKCRA